MVKTVTAATMSDSTSPTTLDHNLSNGHDSTSPSDVSTSHSTAIESNNTNFIDPYEWPYGELNLYRLALNFFKENESKAFHPSYDQRNTLLAYTLQEKFGQFNPDKALPLGALDFVGHDRRNAWISLNNLSSGEARKKFILLLDNLCPMFRTYLTAVRFDLEEKESKKKAEEEIEKNRLEEAKLLEQRKVEEELLRKQEEKQKQFEKQKQTIQEILNKQTYHQFSSYSRQQYPDSPELQQQLIERLQEQHFQQYIQQMLEQSNGSDPEKYLSEKFSELYNQTNATSIDNNNTNGIENEACSTLNDFNKQKTNFKELESSNGAIADSLRNNSINHSSSIINYNNENTNDEDDDEDDDESDERSDCSKQIENASMWTRKDLQAFKESVQGEGGHGILKVGHGEIATIRVPTHDDGSCIFWEFATDHYDIGFGLFFEWNSSPDTQVSVYFSESEDEEEDEDILAGGQHDIEKGMSRMIYQKYSRSQLNDQQNHSSISAIIPIYRRDSHEEVFAGSHLYPGKGVYLLKFDNSYSLWRSKTLYYRVYYTKEQ
ncbi:hypothetical protein QR98_0042240 [Sarcoptes scabiei]|uniref:Golgi resident protein GCP60-like protein n=1 Tax=Sarcoptes scabiei TaxID=52283 RepID=A0A132A541_SARSC|nr:hypothetical protein QR98_0042240 [Sarcoptes scabiei]